MEKIDFIDFANEIIGKEDEKTALSGEIKEAKEIFADKHSMDKKSIAKALKDYKAFLKDQADFTVVDREVAEIIDKVCYETTDTATTESE